MATPPDETDLMRATLKSIAKDLNLSHMTVSRALSGHPNVKPATRDLILARARELGYVKSSAANAMRGDPTAIVGLLLPNIVNEFYARFANTLALLCADSGYDLVIHLTNDEADREYQALARLQALQAGTVIMVPTPVAHPDTPRFHDHMRLIEFIRTRPHSNVVGRLIIEDAPTIAAAVDHLAHRGHMRIAFIGADESLSSGKDRAAAFRAAIAAQSLTDNPDLIRTGAPGFAMGRSQMEVLLDRPTPPDAVICGGFEICSGALDACLRRDVDLPGALAFVGYGNPSAYQWIVGGITTIDLSADDIAERAMKLLLDKTSKDEVRSPTRLLIRNST